MYSNIHSEKSLLWDGMIRTEAGTQSRKLLQLTQECSGNNWTSTGSGKRGMDSRLSSNSGDWCGDGTIKVSCSIRCGRESTE